MCTSVSHNSRGGEGKLGLSEFTGAAAGFSAQRLLQHWGLTSHAAFHQQCPEGHESRVGGNPLFSQTPLNGSWRIPEVGLRAHPLNLCAAGSLEGWNSSAQLLRGGSAFVQSCSKYCPCETAAGQCVPKGSQLEVALRGLGGSSWAKSRENKACSEFMP